MEKKTRAQRFLQTIEDPTLELHKLLELYRTWVEPHEMGVVDVIEYAIDNGFMSVTRRRDVLDGQKYLMAYMFGVRGIGPTDIGRIFNKDHSSVSVALKTFADLCDDSRYIESVSETAEKFPMDITYVSALIREKKRTKQVSKRNRHWMDEEVRFLIMNSDRYNTKEMATILNRTVPSIEAKAEKLRVSLRNNGTFSVNHIEFIRMNIDRMTVAEMSRFLDRDWNSVKYHVNKIKDEDTRTNA